MPQSRPLPLELRRQIVKLAQNGCSVAELACEFEPAEQTIYAWLHQVDRDEGKLADILSSNEREELRRLRKENRQLRQERERSGQRSPLVRRRTIIRVEDAIAPKPSRS